MRHRRLVRILVAFVVAAITAGVMATSAAAAGPHRYQPPDLVAIGDSFAAGTGNVPYQPDDGECDRSASAASSELLARLRLVTLQAFRACQGAKTTDVIAQGQLTAITADTDVVTVQALGNDLGFGALVAYCLDAVPQNPGVTCHRNQVMLPLGGITVQQLLDSIPNRAPAALDGLYDAIDTRIDAVHAKAKVIVVDYGNPFPDPSGWVGPLCPYMDAEELGVATDFANGLNVALQQAAARHGFAFANAAPRFRGLDVCGFASAFYRPPGFPGAPSLPEGARGVLHPNKAGQGIYAAVLAGRLSF